MKVRIKTVEALRNTPGVVERSFQDFSGPRDTFPEKMVEELAGTMVEICSYPKTPIDRCGKIASWTIYGWMIADFDKEGAFDKIYLRLKTSEKLL